MAFGEMAFIDRAPRSATITAETPVSCDMLTLARLTALGVRRGFGTMQGWSSPRKGCSFSE